MTVSLPSPDHDLSYATVRVVTPTSQVSPDDLAIINARFPTEPLTAADVFVFRAVASTDATDSHWTFMDPATTLRNYAADLAAGQSLLDSHDFTRLPIGSSFRGEVQPITDAEGQPATAQVLAAYYLLRNHIVAGTSTEEYRRGILGGTYRKMSIGFGGADVRYVCEIDGRDLWDSDYWPGQRLADGTRVRFKVVDARALETSLVFKNSAPGALVQRVAQLAEQRAIPQAEVARLSQQWGVRFPYGAQPFVVPSPARSPEGDHPVNERQIRALLEGLQQRVGKTISAATRTKIDEAISRASTMQDDIGALVDVLSDLIATDSEERAQDVALRIALGADASVDAVQRLQRAAKAGTAYQADLITQTLQARSAAQGDALTEALQARYRARLETLEIEDLEFERDTWTQQRAQVLAPGRVVGGGTLPSALPVENDANPHVQVTNRAV